MVTFILHVVKVKSEFNCKCYYTCTFYPNTTVVEILQQNLTPMSKCTLYIFLTNTGHGRQAIHVSKQCLDDIIGYTT